MNDSYVEQIQPRRVAADIVSNPASVTQKYKFLLDDVSTTGVTYIGKAPLGSTTSVAVWQIQKLDETGSPVTLAITYADGNSNLDNIWDDRLSLSYS